jgi:Bacterial Ig domain
MFNSRFLCFLIIFFYSTLFFVEAQAKQYDDLNIKNLGKLPIGLVSEKYVANIEQDNGQNVTRYYLAKGKLPVGIILDELTGTISGIPLKQGEFIFMIRLVAANGHTKDRWFSLLVDKTLERSEITEMAPNLTQNKPVDIPQNNNISSKSLTLSSAAFEPTPSLSGLLNIIGSMGEGEWSRVNLNNFSSVWSPAELRPLFGWGNPSPQSIILPWSSFAWDSNRASLFLYGGGHANYRGNDTYIWRASTQMWERSSLPSEVVNTSTGLWNAIDGPNNAPASAHTYDNTIYLPNIDRVLVLGGAAEPNGGFYLTEAATGGQRITGPYLFDLSRADPNKVGGTTGSHVKRVAPHNEITGGQMWTNRESWLNSSASSQPPKESLVNGCTGYAEENGLDTVYVRTANSLYRYLITDINDPTSDIWSKVGIYYFGGSGGQSTCAYDPIRHFFISTYSSLSQPFIFWDITKASANNKDILVAPTDPANEFMGLVSNQSIRLSNCALDYDPPRQNMKLWCGDGRVWSLIPPTSAVATGWTIIKEPVPNNAVPTESIGTGILGKWKYIPNLDVFMGLLDPVQGNIWIYKPVGWVNPLGTVNSSPAVALSEPASGGIFSAGSAITLAATASDADGSIAKVEFFANAAKVGEALSLPYSIPWSNSSPGTYQLTAKAIDNLGAVSTSSLVTIVVNAPPAVAFSEPANGSNISTGSSITLAATASDADGSIAKVEFFANAAKVGEALSSPYSIPWSNLSPGTYQLTAKAIDNLGAVSTSTLVTIVVNTPPAVALSEPVSGSAFTAGSSITLAATASDADGSIAKVEFFANAAKVGEALSLPYSIPWSNLSPGTYQLTAKATDNLGTASTTTPVNINVTTPQGVNTPPAVALSEPASGGGIFTAGSSITMSATASDTDGSIAKVEFFANAAKVGEALSSPYSIQSSNLPAGTYQLSAKATDNLGADGTSSLVSIIVNAPPEVALSEPTSGSNFMAGSSIALAAIASDTDGSIAKVEFFANATKVGEAISSPYSIPWSNLPAGTYQLTAKAIDNLGGNTTSRIVTITVSTTTIDTKVTIQRTPGQTGIVKDTFLSSYHPDLNFGASTTLKDYLYNYSPLFRFSIFQSEGGIVPNNAKIKSAILYVYKNSYYDMTYAVHRVLKDWSETNATWKQRLTGVPWGSNGANSIGIDYESTRDAVATIGWNPGWIGFDVSATVAKIGSGIYPNNFGWQLRQISGYQSSVKSFNSSEYVGSDSLRPKLEIIYN